MTSIENLGGMALILAICGLLFVEELGVPLPFAPGDIVLPFHGGAHVMHDGSGAPPAPARKRGSKPDHQRKCRNG